MAALRTATISAVLAIASFVVPPPAYADEVTQIRIGGTGAALEGMHLIGKAFMKSNPDIRIDVLPSLGSNGGIKALAAGRLELALSSRPMKEKERGVNIRENEYARTPIIFATHRDNPADSIDLEAVTAMYSGATLDWPSGERLRLILRTESKGDTIARLGGDEFAIIQPGNSNRSNAAELAEWIISELSRPFDLSGQEVFIGVSIGAAIYTGTNSINADELLKNADRALYKSKGSGRGTFHFFQEEMDAELGARKLMEADIRKALHDDEFELLYQPQFNLSNQRITVLEALLRWRHLTRGNVLSVNFCPWQTRQD